VHAEESARNLGGDRRRAVAGYPPAGLADRSPPMCSASWLSRTP
jgi:hypothetical protein